MNYSHKPKRRWYQFSLRTFFVSMTAFGIFLAWGVHEGGRRHRAIHRLQKVGASLAFEHEFHDGTFYVNDEPPGSPLLKQVF
jgi:hypothetical protein